jgi:Tfp pilus assembly protein PilP
MPPVKIVWVSALWCLFGGPFYALADRAPTLPADAFTDSAPERDPFAPPRPKPRSTVDESRPELERYELSELRMTGVITGADGNLAASVETATGRGFMVKKGSAIGVNRGIIVEIAMDRLIIKEEAVDQNGISHTATTEMRLRDKKSKEDKLGAKKPGNQAR